METFICCLFLRVRRKQAGKGLGYGDREDGDRGLGSVACLLPFRRRKQAWGRPELTDRPTPGRAPPLQSGSSEKALTFLGCNSGLFKVPVAGLQLELLLSSVQETLLIFLAPLSSLVLLLSLYGRGNLVSELRAVKMLAPNRTTASTSGTQIFL